MEKILFVDDSASMRQMIRFILEDADYEVVEAVDGVEALRKLNNKIDMIITDINMPNLDGVGLLKRVREDPEYKFLPVMVLTKESAASTKQKSKEIGATGWIHKPFKPEELLAAVDKVLDRMPNEA